MKVLTAVLLLSVLSSVSWAESQKTQSAASPSQSSSASFRQQQATQFSTYPLNSVYGLTYQGTYPQLASYLQRPNARPSFGSRLRNFMNSLFFRRNQAGSQQFYSASLPVFNYKPPVGKPDIVQSKPVLYSAAGASGTPGHKIHFPNYQGTKAYKNALSAAGSYPLPHAYLSGYTGKVYNNLYGSGPDKSYGSKIYNTGYKA
ncbi:uncharacterized protein LOC135385652 [Ornithodoros turicata]|uniref:uncharacterized protein LOC135385652 n=1 Tax=Ornithodoros turicata TaxID=34597 RepID=UPI003138EFBD